MSASKAAELGAKANTSQLLRRTLPLSVFQSRLDLIWRVRLAGGTVGCNYQVGNVVLGVENDISWTNKGASSPDMPPFSRGAISSTNEKWIDTLRGRIGWAWDRFLVYGTAGAAFTGVDVGVCSPTAICISDSRTRTGWSAGVGGEWAVWSVPAGTATLKIEYLHADFGAGLFVSPPIVVGRNTFDSRNVRLTDDIVRAGLNWKFQLVNPRPARARHVCSLAPRKCRSR